MKKRNWYILIGVLMVLLSGVAYGIHYMIFRDVHHIFIYMVGDIAFVFLEVLLVSLIIHQLLTERDKRVALEKMNMVIGSFFSQFGNRLLEIFCSIDETREGKAEQCRLAGKWSDRDFVRAEEKAADLDFKVETDVADLEAMKKLLLENRDFMLRLLENPLLLEHESFTDLLWAVFHLTEELASRTRLEGLPESDRAHLAGDIERAYTRLYRQWLGYMLHLKNAYPYLFSLAVRTNPFDPEASPVVG